MREYTDRIRVYVTPEQRALIEEKMKQAGIINMSAYIRKMAIDGFVIRVNIDDLKELTRLTGTISRNINQYAKRANESGMVSVNEIAELKNQLDKIYVPLKGIYQRLLDIPY